MTDNAVAAVWAIIAMMVATFIAYKDKWSPRRSIFIVLGVLAAGWGVFSYVKFIQLTLGH